MNGLGNCGQKSTEERDTVVNFEAALCGRERALDCQVQVDAQERVEEEGDDEEGLERGQADLEKENECVVLGLCTTIEVGRVRVDGLQLKIANFIQRVKQ